MSEPTPLSEEAIQPLGHSVKRKIIPTPEIIASGADWIFKAVVKETATAELDIISVEAHSALPSPMPTLTTTVIPTTTVGSGGTTTATFTTTTVPTVTVSG